MISRFLLVLLGILTVGIIAIYLISDATLLREDPKAGSLNKDQIVYVDDERCGSGQVKRLVGATPTTERTWSCVAYDAPTLHTTRIIWFIEDSFGKLYVVLTVLGTIAAGIAVLHWYVTALRRKQGQDGD